MKIIITEKQEKMLNSNKEIFLGGTCNGSKWRDELIPLLKIKFFNPVVDDWTEDDAKKEIEKRKTCDYILYVITPKMEGVLSIAEVVDDSHKRPDKTIFCVLETDDNVTLEEAYYDKSKFSKAQLKSLNAVIKMVEENGVKICKSLKDIANYVNKL